MKILVTSCIKKLESIAVGLGRKSCVPRPRDGWGNIARKFKSAVSMKKAIKNRKGRNTAAELRGQKTVSKRMEVDEAESLWLGRHTKS